MAKLPDTAVCLTCVYSLRGLPKNRCPECGQKFDPWDATTWKDTAPRHLMKRMWRHWAAPPPRWHTALTITTTLLILVPAALLITPVVLLIDFQDMDATIWYPFVLTSLMLPLGMSYALRVIAIRLTGPPHNRMRRPPRVWAVFPVCLSLILSASLSVWPGRLVFLVSWPFLSRAVTRVERMGRPEGYGQIIGLLPFSRVAPLEAGRVKFQGTVDLVYNRHEPNPPPARYRVKLAPGWHVTSWE